MKRCRRALIALSILESGGHEISLVSEKGQFLALEVLTYNRCWECWPIARCARKKKKDSCQASERAEQ